MYTDKQTGLLACLKAFFSRLFSERPAAEPRPEPRPPCGG